VLSNLYPTQSSIPSHNVYFEPLQAFMRLVNAICGAGYTNLCLISAMVFPRAGEETQILFTIQLHAGRASF
jgi:hypothetical protein